MPRQRGPARPTGRSAANHPTHHQTRPASTASVLSRPAAPSPPSVSQASAGVPQNATGAPQQQGPGLFGQVLICAIYGVQDRNTDIWYL
jgi:hypothetical protein